jgi:hypothetical protein
MTSMMAAFVRALARWAARNADANGPVVIPTGVVSGAELAKVIAAIVTLQRGQAS